MEEAPKKGMSKGCLIGLIVGGSVIVLIIVGLILCSVYSEDLAKAGVSVMVSGVKSQVMEQEVEGVDTTRFNALADGFATKFAESELDSDKTGLFMQDMQATLSGGALSAEDIAELSDAMVGYFPELEEYLPVTVPADTTAVEEPETTEEE